MTIMLLLEIVSLSALSVAMIVLILVAWGNRYAPRPTLAEPVGEIVPFIRIAQNGAVQASSQALRLLGVDAVDCQDARSIFRHVIDERGGFERALSMLQNVGRSMREQVCLPCGKCVEVVGSTAGSEILLTLFDQTALRQRLREAEIGFASARLEYENLMRAHQHSGAICWRTRPDGSLEWSDSAFGSLPAKARADLLAVSSTDDRCKRLTMAGREEAPSDLIVDVRCVDPVQRLFVASAADARIAAEQAMNRLLHTMSETFAHLRVGLMIFDAERRLSLFNPAISDMFGDDTHWLTRRPLLRDLLDRMRQERKLPEQVDYKSWREHILTLVDERNLAPFEELWHLPNGQSLKVLFRPHPSGGLAMIVEDVTESLRLRRIHESERAVRTATTDLLEEGIVVFGPDGKLRAANAAFSKLWCIPEGGVASGQHVGEVLAPCIALSPEVPFWAKVTGAATQGKERTSEMTQLGLRDGRFLSARLSPMPDGSSLLVFSDITASHQVAAALRQRNETLEHADEMRSVLIDQISHQMRTPLNSISGFGQLIAEEGFGPLTETQREYVNGIISCSSELLDAINGMAELISFDGINGPAEAASGPATLRPGDTIADVVKSCERPFFEQNRRIHLAAEESLLTRAGRNVRLRQIIFNLLNDILPNQPDHTMADLTLEREGASLTISCTHPVRQPEAEPGIAMALVRRFVRLEDGRVNIMLHGDGRRTVRIAVPMRGNAVAVDGGTPLAEASGSG